MMLGLPFRLQSLPLQPFERLLPSGDFSDVDIDLSIVTTLHRGNLEWSHAIAVKGIPFRRRNGPGGEFDDDAHLRTRSHRHPGQRTLRAQDRATIAGSGDGETALQVVTFTADSV